MRHLIVLPGNSVKNKAWGELMLKHYSEQFDSVCMVSYDHWESGEANIHFAREEEKIKEYVSSLPSGSEVTVFAKSVGSLLAFLSISHGAIAPAHCVFFGIPFDMAADILFKDSWAPVDSFTVPAIAFHNVEDPTTSYSFTKNALMEHASHIKLITTHEADHWYGDVTTYDQNILK